MKINELDLTPKSTKSDRIPTVYYSRGQDPNKNINSMGAGLYSIVYSKKDKPHEVKRITRAARNPTKEPYMHFLRAILKMQNNPFVPKIYDVRYFKNTEERYFLYIEMERLNPVLSLNWKQLSAMFESVYGKSVSQVMDLGQVSSLASRFATGPTAPEGSEQHVNAMKKRIIRKLVDDIGHIMFKVSGDAYYQNSQTPIQNRALKHAATIIGRALKGQEGFTVDLHEMNVMYRSTPYGAQLVITDPFA